MPSTPPVGVVIANYNNGAFVGRAIESVARQSCRDLRTIVIDDASTDRSDEEIRSCLARLNDSRFDYIRLDTNVGQTGAIKRGLAQLDTPFVGFLDSDDKWYENFIERHLCVHMNAAFPVSLTYCDSHIIDADDRLLAGTAWWFEKGKTTGGTFDANVVPRIDPATGDFTFPTNGRVTFHPQWTALSATNSMASMMFRRSFVDLVLVVPDSDLKLYLDYYLSTFAGLLTGSVAIHDALYAYRMHGSNKHSNASVMGGTYNSSTKDWGPIRDHILRLVERILDEEAASIRAAFGEWRHANSKALVRRALDAESPGSKGAWIRFLDSMEARLAPLLGAGKPGSSGRQWRRGH
ncbi:glycosyltransferase [uncultured Reyranella sp.]|jgi:glycosyltransferase involved in cell wall biosynthesis|uniref:glycosyltransferase family 2 protein n=1 Tax=uncultured Reyranella sp. TaxID=735512 RepID=UPI00259CA4D9|nr:glycosyltransferase [uncultured Reyranella sp.]